jgi:hypothetical protein
MLNEIILKLLVNVVVSRTSPRVQPLHEGVQNRTITGQTRWELPIQAFL